MFRLLFYCLHLLLIFTATGSCAGDPCPPTAHCRLTFDSYECVCIEGYTGTDCETGY